MWQGEKGRETLGYLCISWRELWEGGTDRQMGRAGEKEEEWIEEREKHKKLCRERQRDRLAGGQQEKGCEGRKDRQIWQVCGVEINGLTVGERCVPARCYTHR